MTPERWQEAKKVLAGALERAPEERSVYLDHACTDPVLRREVESLIAAHDQEGASLPAIPSVGTTDALKSGTKLGPYTILARIGAGGMGIVYRAHDPTLQRDVAIKVLPSFLSADPDRLRRFEQEARAAAALNHPNILAVFQFGTHEVAPYLVSELLEGSTLREQLKRGTLPLRKVIDCGVQIARGLAAAHEKGIVHRDLKPENLFVTKDGRVKILDFGLAKLLQQQGTVDLNAPTISDLTEPGAVMGTVGYMSPEQVSGKVADHRADIFAFGAILYEMLTGKRAFQKPTSAETMTAILNEEPTAVSQIAPSTPPALQRVVQRCLEKKPEQRFQSASDLAFALEALSDSSAATATAVAPLPVRRVRPLVAALVALIAVALLVGGGLIFYRSQQSGVPARMEYSQLTNFADSAVAPALSPDGRMLTFIRGGSTFYGPGEIYVKLLPDGEPVQLTHDHLMKMSPQFSPDGSTIAYTVMTETPFEWKTWVVPTLGGEAHLMFPNAEGLTWIDERHLLFSEIKIGVNMAVVTSSKSRADSRDIYVPARERGMAHRSALSPDHKWVLVAEMDNGGWLPCRLLPFDASSIGRQVGPPGAGCTHVAWSPDGNTMYLSSDAGGRFHNWRQRFPDGEPQEITSGATEEEGIAIAPDGASLITSVGLRQSTLWVQDASGQRQITSEGYVEHPRFSADSKNLYYLARRGGVSGTWVNGDLWVAHLETGHGERLLPEFVVAGYDVSPDGTKVVFSTADQQGHLRLWLAPTNFSAPPHEFPSTVNEDQPVWDAAGHIYFRAAEGKSNFLYRMNADGTERRRTISDPIGEFETVSPDGRWALVRQDRGQNNGYETVAWSLDSAASRIVCPGYCLAQWSPGGRTFSVFVNTMGGTRTVVFPLAQGATLPSLPDSGIRAETMGHLTGAKILNGATIPGPTSALSASLHQEVRRNLFRIPLQ